MPSARSRMWLCLVAAALTSAGWIPSSQGQPTDTDQVIYDGSQKVSGVKVKADPEDASEQVAIWTGAEKGHRLAIVQDTIDLSGQEAFCFRFHSAKADGHGVVILCESDPDGGKGNYYQKKFIVDWEGWKTITIPFSDFLVTRSPEGWQRIQRIYFANSGYAGTKPNPEAAYLVDDLVALAVKPPPEPMAAGEALELSSTNSGHTARFDIDPAEENIYGVRYEVKGEPGGQVRLRQYRTYTGSDSLRHKYEVIGHNWDPVVTDGWETRRMEFLTKKGSAAIEFDFSLDGDRPVSLRNVEVKEGGFPDDPPLPEAPYLDWAASLEPNLANAGRSPLLAFGEGGGGLYATKSYGVNIDASELSRLEAEAAPYLKLTVEELIALVPTQRFMRFRPQWGAHYTWSLDRPDQVFDAKTGERFDWEEAYPIQGYEEAVAPSGATVRYAYHDTDPADATWEGQRLYVERFLNDARADALFRAGYAMAGIYRKTGDPACGLRSAALFWAMWRGAADWPVHGRPVWNSPKVDRRLQEPDFYEWFSFVLSDDWYVSDTGVLLYPARWFDLLRDQDAVWEALAAEPTVAAQDPREEAAAGLLHLARQIVVRDAYHRSNEFVFFHNLSGTANRSLIQLGRVLGIPDLVHYGLRKVEGTFRTRFGADGVFPESAWYTGDQFNRQSEALNALTGYEDPIGYASPWDGRRLVVADPTGSVETFGRARDALERQHFPDGSRHTVHDSWALSTNTYGADQAAHARDEVSPFLFRTYGHGILGRGEGPDRIEGHLHWSGHYNHAHGDMLNLILWANGDEMVPDLGYTHISRFATSTVSHNLVVIDRTNQGKGSGEGDLLMWNARKGSPQVVQAAQGVSKVYPQADLYRRSLVMLPFDNGRTAVLDVFEVTGGNRHEWMASGNADYPQELTSDLKPDRTLDNLAADGVPVTDPAHGDDDRADEEPGKPSVFYGAFRNAEVTEMDAPWTATMSPGEQATESDAWAGARAKSTAPKPGLRLHWLGPVEGEAILADSPRARYFDELHNKPAAREAWAGLRMPKVIVAREGENLKSTFVAAWEPFHEEPFLEEATTLTLTEGEGMAWKIAGGATGHEVLYRPADHPGTVATDTLRSDGRFAVRGTAGEKAQLSLYGGQEIADGDLIARVNAGSAMPVTGLTSEGGAFVLTVEAPAGERAAAATYNTAEGEYVRFAQAGSNHRWFRVHRTEPGGGGLRLILADDPGFTFDAEVDVLRETYFPHRVLHGAATVTLPSWLNVRTARSAGTTEVSLRASGTMELTLKGHGPGEVRLHTPSPDGGTWTKLASTTSGPDLHVVVLLERVTSEWTQVRVTKD